MEEDVTPEKTGEVMKKQIHEATLDFFTCFHHLVLVFSIVFHRFSSFFIIFHHVSLFSSPFQLRTAPISIHFHRVFRTHVLASSARVMATSPRATRPKWSSWWRPLGRADGPWSQVVRGPSGAVIACFDGPNEPRNASEINLNRALTWPFHTFSSRHKS